MNRWLRHFAEDLKKLLEAGVPLVAALDCLGEPSRGKPAAAEYANALRARVADGVAFAEALAERTDGMTAAEIALVDAGERAGKLTEALGRIAEDRAQQDELRGELKARGTYSFVMYILAVVLLPVYLVVQGKIAVYLLFVGLGLLPVAAFLYIFRHGSKLLGGTRIGLFLMRLPVLGGLLVTRAVGRVCHTLGLLLEAGMSFADALPLVAKTTDWPDLVAAVSQAGATIEKGGDVTEAFRALGDLSPLNDWGARVRAGEESGTVDATFRQIAADLELRFRSGALQLLRVLPLALLLLVGVIVFLQAFMVMSRYYSDVGL